VPHWPVSHTQDIDIALASPVTDVQLRELGYVITNERGKKTIRTKEGFKVDIYMRDVSGLSIHDVFETAVVKQIGCESVRVMGLEALLLSKLRANRSQDIQDIRIVCQRLKKKIRWELTDRLGKHTESAQLRIIVKALG
jgi:hypothetical protein